MTLTPCPRVAVGGPARRWRNRARRDRGNGLLVLAFLPQVRTRLGTGSLASSQCGVWLVRAARARSGEETSSKASIRDRAPSNDDHSREGSTSPLAKAWACRPCLGPLVETRVVDTMRSCTPRLWSPDRRAPRRETETASIDAGDTARAGGECIPTVWPPMRCRARPTVCVLRAASLHGVVRRAPP